MKLRSNRKKMDRQAWLASTSICYSFIHDTKISQLLYFSTFKKKISHLRGFLSRASQLSFLLSRYPKFKNWVLLLLRNTTQTRNIYIYIYKSLTASFPIFHDSRECCSCRSPRCINPKQKLPPTRLIKKPEMRLILPPYPWTWNSSREARKPPQSFSFATTNLRRLEP